MVSLLQQFDRSDASRQHHVSSAQGSTLYAFHPFVSFYQSLEKVGSLRVIDVYLLAIGHAQGQELSMPVESVQPFPYM